MNPCTLILLTLLAGSVRSNAQSNFIRVTNTVLTAESFSGGGAAWADYDGDGWLDLAQANFAVKIRLCQIEPPVAVVVRPRCPPTAERLRGEDGVGDADEVGLSIGPHRPGEERQENQSAWVHGK